MQRDLHRDVQPDPSRSLTDLSSSAAERHTLHELRQRDEEDRHLWTPREFARLRFLRWLAQTGRLVEDGGPAADGAAASGR